MNEQALMAIRHGLAQARAALAGDADSKLVALARQGIEAAQSGYGALVAGVEVREDRDEYAKRLRMAVELLERIEREASWIGDRELEAAIEDFTDMMREDGWVR